MATTMRKKARKAKRAAEDRSDPPTPGQVRAAWRKYRKLLDDCEFQHNHHRAETERVRLLAETTKPDDPLAAVFSAVQALVARYYPDAAYASVHLSFPSEREHKTSVSMPVFWKLRPEDAR